MQQSPLSKQEVLNIAISKIRARYPLVKGIYYFGSFGSEYEKKESDLDLAILPDKKTDPLACWSLAQDIASIINRNVDLIDLTQVSTVFQFEIISRGTRIDCQDKNACENFEDLVYAMYIRLNDSRFSILKDIQQQGKILNG